ncbi:winged helix-turn-helix domain-containing protein [Methylomicrobium lacus]|uniref:winged helix-turn-helix transcriptional regulator n=1 Tax=Methylomicrobium lacus TaxID=136992 RepID=UPI0035A8DB8E
MQEIRKIMNFYDDQYFLFMLRGYCYSNNIRMTEASLDREGINEIAECNPDLIFIPLDWINATGDMGNETDLLKRVCKSRDIKICGLNGQACDRDSEETPTWIDRVINNPLDIAEIDTFIKNSVLCGCCFTERRINSERRTSPDRRLNARFSRNRYDSNKVIDVLDLAYTHHAAGNMELAELHIDTRNKILFVKGYKIDLTPKEFDLIAYLATDLDRVFSPEEIIKYLWPNNDRATKSDLYQYIHLLRKKIENIHDNQQLILTVKGFGYRLNISKN